jgi:transposase
MRQLTAMIDDPTTEARVRTRCLIVRASVEGESNISVAKNHNTSAHTVINWTRRFVQEGAAGLYDQPRSGRPKMGQSTVTLTRDQTDKLKQITRRAKVDQQTALRARIVLACSEGLDDSSVASKLNCTVPTVRKWRERFAEKGLESLADLPRSGAPRTISDRKVEEVITRTLEEQPEDATHWSTRSMAERCGLSHGSVMRIWHAFELKPHRQEKFQLSTDPFFVEKVRDVVGLYMCPPENAIVLCVDEKSQIQALERSQPVLPMRPRRSERASHDYYRHGTVSLFAALDILTGEVIGRCEPNHTHKEFLKFLRAIEKQVPEGLQIHAVLDNYGTHKTPAVKKWLEKHPRWHFHFIPTHSSWLNQVERWFAKITDKKIRRGVFRSVKELTQSIEEYIQANNKAPKPFVWTASTELILGKINKICKKLKDGSSDTGH